MEDHGEAFEHLLPEDAVNSITTHVLDTAKGKPAAGVPVLLELQAADGAFHELGRGVTDDDGRLRTLLGEKPVETGIYRITFDTTVYFGDADSFFPWVTFVFRVKDATSHYHVPLLLAPYGIATYRGS
jgi:5-hydroxyisourate hydrolase